MFPRGFVFGVIISLDFVELSSLVACEIWTDSTAPEKKASRYNPQHAG
jgi:hypothetical protein